MPDFWQFPTVSMGLGPIMAIYQARFMRYLTDRGIADTSGRKVWCFLGDGETDEPESLGAIALAGREKLGNLVFVVNCNLQRLDGPVRGNGKIIQELETIFRGAGWNVLKVIWGDRWDPLLEADHDGLLVKRMEEAVDGEYQVYKARDGAYVREHFFGKYPELAERVEDMTDEEIWDLNRGGHDAEEGLRRLRRGPGRRAQPDGDPREDDQGLRDGRGRRGPEHHPPAEEDERGGAARLPRPLRARDLRRGGRAGRVPQARPTTRRDDATCASAARRSAGYLPARRRRVEAAARAAARDRSSRSSRAPASARSRRRWRSSASSRRCCATSELGPRVVPIVPDESRTFGMEGMFRQLGIYSHVGQLYEPEDAGQLMFYREDRKGQVLQEGINEAGAFSSWIAAATSYSNHDVQMVPFYAFYSMFGFQRIGDLAWAAGDSRARGFLIGGTAGRTTLNGEGLQHEDGHSHVLAATIPNCVSYDPAYAYELAVIVHEGLRRMVAEQEDVFYYLTVMNENYRHPPLPEGSEEGILRGMHRIREIDGAQVRLLGLRHDPARGRGGRRAAGPGLRDPGRGLERHQLHRAAPRRPRARARGSAAPARPSADALGRRVPRDDGEAPVIAATDYMKALPDGIRAWVPGRYEVLGTDGFGRSDFRRHLRSFFEVDRHHVVVAALRALAAEGSVEPSVVADAIARYEIDPDAPDPAVS